MKRLAILLPLLALAQRRAAFAAALVSLCLAPAAACASLRSFLAPLRDLVR